MSKEKKSKDLLTWEGYEWEVGERWGLMHPGKTECWYDKSAVEIVGDELHLHTHYNPIEIDGKESPFGVGLINCTTKFGYGRYDIDIKLPTGSSSRLGRQAGIKCKASRISRRNHYPYHL